MGYDVSINHNGRTGAKPLHWEYQQQPGRRQLYEVYAALIKLKLSYPVFRTSDFTLSLAGPVKQVTLRDPAMTVHLLGNFDVQGQQVAAGFPAPGTWYDYFSGQQVVVANTGARISLQPGEFHLYTNVKLPAPKAGLVPWTQAFTNVTALPAGQQALALQLYPNPATDQTLLQWEDPYRGQVHLEIRDVTGRLHRQLQVVKRGPGFRQTISLRGLAAGIYSLQVRQGSSQVIKKLVKL